ncbi:MAG: iron-sulfur cluster assembly scaffold protein [Deltaproteobacteria bacterium]|nr:iron-sulfur cluster assembly scaffold protein [Deltaproteobacteria bacterium]
MNDKFDAFVEDLQNEIFNEAKEAFGEAGFERWRNPKYNGRMQNCDAYARVKGKCGDTMEIYLKFSGDRVQSASYVTDGCASSSICGSFTSEMATGKDFDELTGITGESVLKMIGGFPEEDKHCAFLAAETLQEALRWYMVRVAKKK